MRGMDDTYYFLTQTVKGVRSEKVLALRHPNSQLEAFNSHGARHLAAFVRCLGAYLYI